MTNGVIIKNGRRVDVRRNHLGYRVGEAHQKAVLSDDDVRVMRQIRDETGAGYRLLGEMFGTPAFTVRDIVTYRTRAAA